MRLGSTIAQPPTMAEKFAKLKRKSYSLKHRIKIGKPPIKNEFGLLPIHLKMIQMISQGKSLKEISAETGRSGSGIVHSIRRLTVKFECRTKTQLVAVCYQKGILN